MLLATSAAVSRDIGLIITFGGLGLVVNVIVVYVAIQVRGERASRIGSTSPPTGAPPVLEPPAAPRAARSSLGGQRAAQRSPVAPRVRRARRQRIILER